jgi:HEAT repeat protein
VTRDDLPWLRELLSSCHVDTVGCVWNTITHIATSEDLPWLRDALTGSDDYAAYWAGRAIEAVGDPSSLPWLREALKDSNPHVGEAAAYALGRIGDKRAIPWLRDALASEDASIQEAAAHALADLDAKDDALPWFRAQLAQMRFGTCLPAAKKVLQLAGGVEAESILEELRHDMDAAVAGLFDWHLYAPEWVKEAFRRECRG